jgi:hypothetical protein
MATAVKVAASASKITLRIAASRHWVKGSLMGTQRLGQQAFPQGTYPPGQAETDVAAKVVAKIVMSSPILMLRMVFS